MYIVIHNWQKLLTISINAFYASFGLFGFVSYKKRCVTQESSAKQGCRLDVSQFSERVDNKLFHHVP